MKMVAGAEYRTRRDAGYEPAAGLLQSNPHKMAPKPVIETGPTAYEAIAQALELLGPDLVRTGRGVYKARRPRL